VAAPKEKASLAPRAPGNPTARSGASAPPRTIRYREISCRLPGPGWEVMKYDQEAQRAVVERSAPETLAAPQPGGAGCGSRQSPIDVTGRAGAQLGYPEQVLAGSASDTLAQEKDLPASATHPNR